MRTLPIHFENTALFPLFHEMSHALTRLLSHQEEHAIDLHRLPLSRGDKQHLLTFLGKGEVKAELSALGQSMIWETSFPGIWIVEHYDAQDLLLSQTLEITWIPTLLKSQPEDVQVGLDRLQHYLSSSS